MSNLTCASMAFIIVAEIINNIPLYAKATDNVAIPEIKIPKAEDLLKELRKISFKNKMIKDAEITLTFRTSDSDALIQNHYLPSGQEGWIPFFVSGKLEVACFGKSISFDISDATKEYLVIILPDGTIEHTAKVRVE